MVKEYIDTGKTVDEAIDAACEKLGVSKEDVNFEILDLPKKGFLGIKSTPAKVRVYIEQSKADIAKNYLSDILTEMGISCNIAVSEQDNGVVLTLDGDGLGVIIGRRGETLDSLQYLVSLVANRCDGEYMRVTIDSGNYRDKREKTLEALARKLAFNSVKTGRSNTLEPMNPYERRIIHAAVSTVRGATSTSIGEEPNRRVVISSVTGTPAKAGGDRGGFKRGGKSSGKGGFNKPYNRGGRNDNIAKPAASAANAAPAKPATVDAQDKPLYSKIEID
ncbi:MAG TPA: single-stranded DNA-binding protein [Ruminococcaceae bacterium]|nr:single-stranded DNA-binding protein [Oscillospiraceae bacterium]